MTEIDMAEKDNNKYIWVYNHYRSIRNIEDFLNRERIKVTPEDFFKINKELIWNQYTDALKKKVEILTGKYPESIDDLKVDSLLPCPCTMRIQASKVEREIAISQTNFQALEGDFYAFASEQIADIIQNEGYQISEAEKRAPTVQVFGWFKSLYYVGLSSLDKSKATINAGGSEFVDLSKHVMSLSTLVGENGGSFTLRLPIINAPSELFSAIERGGTEQIEIGKGKKNDKQYRVNGEFYSKNNFNLLESNYFNWLISSNDILFIAFEKLNMDIYRGVKDEDTFDIKADIAAQTYDMIALVDEVRVVTDAVSSNAYVEVTGRDLMKLLIDDGSFFFNPSTSSDPSSVFDNEASFGKQGDIREADMINNKYNDPINRLRGAVGQIDVFANRLNMDLTFVLKGVISQLANVEVVPAYVFESYGDERTTFVSLEPVNKEGEIKK